jgi:hypothetical protein
MDDDDDNDSDVYRNLCVLLFTSWTTLLLITKSCRCAQNQYFGTLAIAFVPWEKKDCYTRRPGFTSPWIGDPCPCVPHRQKDHFFKIEPSVEVSVSVRLCEPFLLTTTDPSHSRHPIHHPSSQPSIHSFQ